MMAIGGINGNDVPCRKVYKNLAHVWAAQKKILSDPYNTSLTKEMMQASQSCVWEGIRRLAAGYTVTRQQTTGLLHTPIRQACHMMRTMFEKATKGPVTKDALDFALSYVILFYEWHLDGPRVVFTRPLRQRTLLSWSGGIYYRLEEPGSIDLLEMIRNKFHELEQNPRGVVSDSGFLHGPLSPIDQEYVALKGKATELYSYATPHHTFPILPCLNFTKDKELCVYCRTHMHTTYECDPFRQYVKRRLELSAGGHHCKNKYCDGDDSMEARPTAGPLISSKRVPDTDSPYYYGKLQSDIPRPGQTARDTHFGQLRINPTAKDNRMELRVEYTKPFDKPQVGETQDTKGTWKYDSTAWFSGWKFTREKTPHMKASCIGLLIDPANDEKCLGRSRDAWFIRRRECNLEWSFNVFPPWDDHVIPSVSGHEDTARDNRLHMISSHEFYCKEFGVTMVNRRNPVPPGVLNQRRNSCTTRLLPVRVS